MKHSAAAIRSYVAKARAAVKAPEAKIPGGTRLHPRRFAAAALEKGTAHELEHTTSIAVAMEIAMDHLAEDQSYYTKLAKVERPQAAAKSPKLYGGRVIR